MDCPNYSVGFRAPNQQDLFSSFADHVIDTDSGQKRYTDHTLALRDSKGELLQSETDKVKTLMQALLNNDELFKHWLGNTLSQAKHEMDLSLSFLSSLKVFVISVSFSNE